MRFWLWRAPLAAVLAVVLVVGTLSAQDWGGPAATPDGKYFPYGPVEVMAATQPPQQGPVTTFLHKLNIGCYSTMHSAGCGNLNTEVNYIFGSCHDWYGEPCKVAPPHGIGQAAYGPQSGYGSSGLGCNCGP
jgi:hypothetical protein